MEQIPGWLEATVYAAGVTAYAEEVERAPLDHETKHVEPGQPSNDERYH